MAHVRPAKAERLLDKPIRVLDHGFVRLVDYMGGDARIVQTARVSYGAGTKTVREDAALIDYLMRHGHTSPFEHVVLEFHCKIPLFVARQWIRHRTARLNEISGRYSVLNEEFYTPPDSQICRQSQDNKQGRDSREVPPELRARVLELLREDQARSYATYSKLLDWDLARELARINLPLSLYTEWYWQMDLHNLFHFLELRLDPHAQWEIRQYAEALARIAAAVAPMAYEAFERHRLKGCRLAADEIEAVQALLQGNPNPLRDRRRKELEAKLGISGRPAKPEKEGKAEGKEPPALLPGGLAASIRREEINRLPIRRFEGPVHVVADDTDLRKAVRALSRERLLGFDTESRPSFQRGQVFPVALLQLAGAKACYIFQLQILKDLTPLWDLLAQRRILKVGVALDGDIQRLRERAPLEPAGFLDLATETTRLGIQNNGLRALCALLLGFRISKSAQRTNWARETLTEKQIVYAATDAWAGREIYLDLVRRGLIKAPVKTAENPSRS